MLTAHQQIALRRLGPGWTAQIDSDSWIVARRREPVEALGAGWGDVLDEVPPQIAKVYFPGDGSDLPPTLEFETNQGEVMIDRTTAALLLREVRRVMRTCGFRSGTVYRPFVLWPKKTPVKSAG